MDFGDVTLTRAQYDQMLADIAHLFDCHRIIRSFGVLLNNPTEQDWIEVKHNYQHWIRDDWARIKFL